MSPHLILCESCPIHIILHQTFSLFLLSVMCFLRAIETGIQEVGTLVFVVAEKDFLFPFLLVS